MTAPKICKRCGGPLSKYAFKRVCYPCQGGKGAMYEPPKPGRRSPEVPGNIEGNRRRH